MNFNQFPKISIKVLGGIFLFLTLNFALWTFNFPPAFAQDALQCTPNDVRINRNLHVINGNNIFLENSSGVSGKLYIGANAAAPSYGRSGSDLLLTSPASILFQSNGNYEFQNSSGNAFAQFFTGATPALPGTGNLLVNGKIEGLGAVQGSQICVTGSGIQCVSSWNTINTAAYGEIDTDTRCDTSGTCNQLCIGASCYNSWATAVSSNGGGVSSVNAGTGISISSTTGNVTVNNTGVTNLTAGPGITLSGSTGDVTISASGSGLTYVGSCNAILSSPCKCNASETIMLLQSYGFTSNGSSYCRVVNQNSSLVYGERENSNARVCDFACFK